MAHRSRIGLVFLLIAAALPAAHDAQRQHAPPDAYLPGDPLPYYGSDNPWDRRFFTDEVPARVGQPQMLLLQEGHLEEAIAMCHARLAANGIDAESHLVLALAYGLQGRLDDAQRALQAALELGLPPERILVGPRSLLGPLRKTEIWQRLESESSGLLHGPLVGSVTPRSARFWVRTLHESDVEVRLSRHGDFTKPDAIARARTSAENDYTAVIEAAGLASATEYTYQLVIDGRPVPRWPEWQFRTFPAEGSSGLVRVASGGCAKYWPPNERMWDVIRLRRPDALLLMGDNVYIDLPERQCPFLDYSYYQRQSRPEFRRLVASVPTYAIWDDHDAGIDDIFLGPYPDKPAWKVDYLRLFKRNWANPGYGAEPATPGVWFGMRIGAVEFFMLDGRYYRENFLKSKASMLGPVQKQWLFDSLARSTAMFKVIVSDVAFADDAKEHTDPASGAEEASGDTWSGFKSEREELFSHLTDHHISGVLLLSADRHRADLRLNQRAGAYPLYELMCSRLTNPRGSKGAGHPLWQYTDGPCFALLTFDCAAAEPAVTLEVATIEGEPVLRKIIALHELRDQ